MDWYENVDLSVYNLRQSVYLVFDETIRVGTLTRMMNDACEDLYVFKIFWDVWDAIDDDSKDIDGLDMRLRQERYYRSHLPAFIHQHVPPRREDSLGMMSELGMNHWDRWDFMIRTHRKTNDRYTVELVNPEEISKQVFV